jgi:hypothetical protein
LNVANPSIAAQLQQIQGKIRELPVKRFYKNSLSTNLDRALQFSAQGNTMGILTCIAVINDKLRTQQSVACCSSGFNSIFTEINHLQQILLESPIVGSQSGPPGPPGRFEFLAAFPLNTVCFSVEFSEGLPRGTIDLQRNILYVADGILIFWLCDIVFIAEPVPVPVNFWRIFGAPPEIIDGAGIAQQIPSMNGSPQSASIQIYGQSGAQYQLVIATSIVGGPVSQVRLVFTAGIFDPGSYIGFNPEKTTYYNDVGFNKINSGNTIDFYFPP